METESYLKHDIISFNENLKKTQELVSTFSNELLVSHLTTFPMRIDGELEFIRMLQGLINGSYENVERHRQLLKVVWDEVIKRQLIKT